MNALNIHNIANGNGVAISLTGMSIVFCGLILISFSLWLLPRVLSVLERVTGSETDLTRLEPTTSIMPKASATDVNQSANSDIAGILGLVLQLEDQRLLAKLNANPQPLPN